VLARVKVIAHVLRPLRDDDRSQGDERAREEEDRIRSEEEDRILERLKGRKSELGDRIDAEVRYQLPGCEAGELIFFRGSSIGIEIPILVAAGIVQYGSLRSGFDYLRGDLPPILRRELRHHGVNPLDIETLVVLGERFNPPAPAAAATSPDTGVPVAAWLIGGVAFLTAVLAAIGADAANVDRVRINFPVLFSVAILVLIVAILAGVLYPVVISSGGADDRRRRIYLAIFVGLIGLSIASIAYLTTISLSAKSRPRIVARLERGAAGDRVTGSVTAAGLKSKEHIAVRVIGISTRERLSEQHVGHARGHEEPTDRQVVYSSRTGPDSAGVTQVALDVAVGSGLYERLDVEGELISEEEVEDAARSAESIAFNRCDQRSRQFSCMSLVVPPAPRRPQLAAHWNLPPGRPPVLRMTARMVGLSSEDRLLLSVRRVNESSLGGRIYATSWAPDPAGAVNEEVELAITPGGRPICILLRTREAGLEAGPETEEGFGPCRPRSRGVAVFSRPPARQAKKHS
jgi:hypothetical protein